MKRQRGKGELWAIVLAAGEGTRLASITGALDGSPVAKQFAHLGGDRTFLQRTMDRVAPLVPPERTVVVVAEHQRDLAAQQLGRYRGVKIVSQPANRGTGPGVLLPLTHVLAKDPEARVVVLPSDHYLEREAPFVDAVRRALDASAGTPSGVVLVAAAARTPATDLGWIVCGNACGRPSARARRVARFSEKPDQAGAEALLERGALWNTLILAARGGALWSLLARHMPQTAQALARYRDVVDEPGADAALKDIYTRVPAADLSRDILERADGLAVVTMADAGWSDCGTPERLFRALETTGELPQLKARLERSRLGSPAGAGKLAGRPVVSLEPV
jgi:mannose-1-phosphate guanylyltransferase